MVMSDDHPGRDPIPGFESRFLRNFSSYLGLILGARECPLNLLLCLALLALLLALLLPVKGGM